MANSGCEICGCVEMFLQYGRCRSCFESMGLANVPPPDHVKADKKKVTCKRCGEFILPITAWRTLGHCYPCLPKKDLPPPTDPAVARSRYSRVVRPDVDSERVYLFSRYQSGEYVAVWDDIHALGDRIGHGENWNDVCKTIRMCMEKVRANVETVVDRLDVVGYEFEQPNAVHVPPDEHSLGILDQLEAELGTLPLSLRYFYEVVGSVDLRQSYQQLHESKDQSEVSMLGELWPLFVASPSELLNEHRSYLQDGRLLLPIAPCFAGLAHYSGDANYILMPQATADFRWRLSPLADDPEDECDWFIDILRRAFCGGGFQGKCDEESEWEPTLPNSKLIDYLSEGLLLF